MHDWSANGQQLQLQCSFGWRRRQGHRGYRHYSHADLRDESVWCHLRLFGFQYHGRIRDLPDRLHLGLSLPIAGMGDVLDPGNVNILTDGCVGAAFVGSSGSGTSVSVDVNPSQTTDTVFFLPTAVLGISNADDLRASTASKMTFLSLRNQPAFYWAGWARPSSRSEFTATGA
jgi:hypothetical protein